jgi:hypothetical protein
MLGEITRRTYSRTITMTMSRGELLVSIKSHNDSMIRVYKNYTYRCDHWASSEISLWEISNTNVIRIKHKDGEMHEVSEDSSKTQDNLEVFKKWIDAYITWKFEEEIL